LGKRSKRPRVTRAEKRKWMKTTKARTSEMVYSLESVSGVNRVAEGGRTLEGSKADESELALGKVVLCSEEVD
jgi:hypothetical protein